MGTGLRIQLIEMVSGRRWGALSSCTLLMGGRQHWLLQRVTGHRSVTSGDMHSPDGSASDCVA